MLSPPPADDLISRRGAVRRPATAIALAFALLAASASQAAAQTAGGVPGGEAASQGTGEQSPGPDSPDVTDGLLQASTVQPWDGQVADVPDVGLEGDAELDAPGLGAPADELSVLDVLGPDGVYRLRDGDGEIPLRLLGPVDAASTGIGADAARSGQPALAKSAATAYAGRSESAAPGSASDGPVAPITPSNWLVSDSGQLFLLVGGVNVVFGSGLGEAEAAALLARHGVEAGQVSPLGEVDGAYLVSTVSDAESLLLADALASEAGVVSAVPNLFTPMASGPVPLSSQTYTPTTARTDRRCSPYEKLWPDRFAGCLWHLNAGTDYRYFGVDPTIDINLGDVWDTTMGAGVTVAVVDGTWEVTHEDIAPNADTARSKIWGGFTGENPNQPSPYHGTAVAGIVGARDNSVGGRGVAPRVTLVNYNFLDKQSTANHAASMTLNMATVAAYNLSYGVPEVVGLTGTSELWRRAVDEGLGNGFGGKGSSYVTGTGNDGATPGQDWATLEEKNNHRGVITVCAVDSYGRSSYWTERGPSLWVCAPSKSRYQAGILAPIGKNGYTDYFGGTSAATPMVSGVIALMRSVNADLTWRDVKVILADTAQKNDASSTSWMSGAAKYGSSTESYSFSYDYGFGTVDAKAAVTAASGWTLLPAEMSAEATSGAVASLPAYGNEIELSLDVQSAMDFVEHVSVEVNAETYDLRRYRWTLVSPSGAESLLAPQHTSCAESQCGLRGTFRFGSSRHLGENPSGTWKLKVRRHAAAETGCSSTLTANSSRCRKISSFAEQIKSWKVVVSGHQSASGQAVSVSVSPSSVTEGSETDVSVTVAGTAPTQNLVIPLKITDGTTTAAGLPGADRGTLASITVPAGASSASAKLATIDDSVHENDETFTVALGTLPTGYRPTGGAATVTVVNDDPLPAVTLNVASTTVTEGDSATITAGLSGTSSQDVTLDVSAAAVAPAKAADGSLGASTTLTIAAGSTASTGTVTFTAAQNDVDEPADAARAFTITAAASGGNGVANPAAVTLTITDDDGAPAGYVVDAGVVSRVEALAGQVQHGPVHVNRWSRVLVAFGEHDGTGVTGGAMTAEQAQQMADAHSSPVWDEVVAELTALEAAGSPPLPELSITAGSGITEGGTATFTVTASPAPASPITVKVAVSESGSVGASGAATVAVSAASTTYTVATSDDSTDEADGSVTATLKDGSGYTVSSANGAATVIVADNDDPPVVLPVVSVTSDGDVTEGSAAVFTVSATTVGSKWPGVLGLVLPVSVTVSTSGDYGVTAGGKSLSISRVAGSVKLSVPTTGDDVDEADGSVTVTVDASSAYTVSASAGSASAVVADDDDPPAGYVVDAAVVARVRALAGQIQHGSAHVNRWRRVLIAFGEHDGTGVSGGAMTAAQAQQMADRHSSPVWDEVVAELTALEAAGSPPLPELSISGGSGITEGGTASFTITASPVPAAPISVKVGVSESGSFGASGAATVTVSGATTTYTVITSDDSTDEADGSVTATLQDGSGYTVSATKGSATVAVADDDDPPVITPVVSITAGGGVTEGGTASFTVTASPAPASPITVKVGVSQSGSFGASGAATVTLSGPSATYTVTTADDQTDEADGSVTATLLDGSGYTVSATQGAATVTVADDDDPPVVTPVVSIAAGGGITEGGTATFTITASPAPASPITVKVAVSESGSFGATGAATVTVSGATTTYTVTTSDDSTDEADGSVTATLKSGSGYTVSATQGAATVTVADNDDPPPQLSVTVEAASAAEGEVLEFKVVLSRASGEQVTVAWNTATAYDVADSRARRRDDYEDTYSQLVFAPGVTEVTGEVWLEDDGETEGDEHFAVEAFLPGSWFRPDAVGIMTITDND